MGDVQIVSFVNDTGLRLFGTLHFPGTPNRALPAVILLSPGVKMRVGPGRLYLPLTELMNSLGYTVMRFDFHGLGDSEGDLDEAMLTDVYNHIEVGRYVGDTLSAMRWLREQHGCRRFMLGGLCGGAITALLAAERDKSVDSLLSLGMTVTLASNSATPAKYLTHAELDSRRHGYYRRLLQPKSWLRLLTFQSEYGVISRSMKRLFVKEPPPTAPAADSSAAIELGNFNPLFGSAYFAFLQRGGRVLMIFSEKDRLQWEYEEKFVALHRQRLADYKHQIDQHVIPGANHVLSFHEWRDELLIKVRSWLLSRPVSGASP